MEHVVLVIHLIVTLVMIVLILLQRSEGGGLGLGTGGGLGSFASAQSTANALTKATKYAAMVFFVTSIILAILAAHSGSNKSILDVQTDATAATTAPAESVPAVANGTPTDATKATKKLPDTKTGTDAPAVPIAK